MMDIKEIPNFAKDLIPRLPELVTNYWVEIAAGLVLLAVLALWRRSNRKDVYLRDFVVYQGPDDLKVSLQVR